jgi:hypothetical protein
VAKNYLEEAKNTNRSFDVVFVSDATQRGGLRKKKNTRMTTLLKTESQSRIRCRRENKITLKVFLIDN